MSQKKVFQVIGFMDWLKGEIRDIGSLANMKGYWIGIARHYFVFNF